MGGLQPFLVLTGTAWAMTPIATAQLSKYKQETVNGPGMLASNIAQAGATLAVAVKTKNKDLKQLAGSAGLSALMGITEPSLFGVTLKLRKPLIASMIGGAIAGLYAGLSGMVRYAFVSPGIAGLAAFIGKNPMNIVHAVITCLIAFIATFIITWFIGFDDLPEMSEHTETTDDIIEVKSPLIGEAIPLSQVNDGIFSKELLGKGIAIKPQENIISSPIEGEVVTVLDSKHAIGIRSKQGAEILIHIGIDTVNLHGKPFKIFVKEHDFISIGQKLFEVDFESIKSAGYDETVILVVTNSEQFSHISEHTGQITKNSTILDIY